jgi:hypothetical protein
MAMIELYKQETAGQFLAALAMLQKSIDGCPEDLWDGEVGVRKYWEIAYHTVHFGNLYLTLPGSDWPDTPDWAWPHAHGLGRRMEPPFDDLTPDEIGPTLAQNKVSEYCASLVVKMRTSLASETEESLAAESGFEWLEFARVGVYIYNLRHIQHHVGQLAAVLRREGHPVDWVKLVDP